MAIDRGLMMFARVIFLTCCFVTLLSSWLRVGLAAAVELPLLLFSRLRMAAFAL